MLLRRLPVMDITTSYGCKPRRGDLNRLYNGPSFPGNRLTLFKRGFLMALLVSAVAGCSSSPSQTTVSADQTANATAISSSQTLTPNLDDYVIGPQDLLDISVFQADELSRKVRVSSRGNFSMPPIGTLEAAGLTAAELEAQIAAKLGECCLQEPQVSIFIEEFVSQRVTVEGEVKNPGVYPLRGRTTLLQGLALAAGSGEIADLSQVKILRENNGGNKDMLVYNLSDIREGKVADPVIQGNDIIVVDRSTSRAALKGVTDTLRGFIGFGTL